MSQNHTNDTDAGWDSLPTSNANGRKALVLVHYAKAKKRLDAGVPFIAIYAHYKTLDFDASLATFRKHWKECEQQIQANAALDLRLEKLDEVALQRDDKFAQHSAAT